MGSAAAEQYRMLRCTVLFLVSTLSENQVTSHMEMFWWPRNCSGTAVQETSVQETHWAVGPPPECCKTVGSNNTAYGELCVFPFKLKGVEYNACTYVESEKLWCATEVQDDGVMVPNRYGDCDLVENVNGESICPFTKCEEAPHGKHGTRRRVI